MPYFVLSAMMMTNATDAGAMMLSGLKDADETEHDAAGNYEHEFHCALPWTLVTGIHFID